MTLENITVYNVSSQLQWRVWIEGYLCYSMRENLSPRGGTAVTIGYTVPLLRIASPTLTSIHRHGGVFPRISTPMVTRRYSYSRGTEKLLFCPPWYTTRTRLSKL